MLRTVEVKAEIPQFHRICAETYLASAMSFEHQDELPASTHNFTV